MDFKLDLDVRAVERKSYTVTKDVFAIHDTVVKLNLARIRSYIDDVPLKLDYDNEDSKDNQVAIRVHASIEVDRVDDLIAHLENLRDSIQESGTAGHASQSQTLALSGTDSALGATTSNGTAASVSASVTADDGGFDDSAGAQDLGLRIVVHKLSFATRDAHDAWETHQTEQILSKLWTRHIELKERDAFLESHAGELMIRLCVRYHRVLEYMLVAKHFGSLTQMHLSDLPFVMSFIVTDRPLYVPHELTVHDYYTTLSCQEFVITSPSTRKLRSRFQHDDNTYTRDIVTYARRLAEAVADSRQVCTMLSEAVSEQRAELELRPVLWLESREEKRARWHDDGDDACSTVSLRVYIWQEPPINVSSMCHTLAVQQGMTFQQLMEGRVGDEILQLGRLMEQGRQLVYAMVEEALDVWSRGNFGVRRNREYVQRLLDCQRVSTKRGDRLWIQCRTVDVSTSTREVLAVCPQNAQLYKVRSTEASSVEACPIPWMWPSGLSVTEIENRLGVKLTAVDCVCKAAVVGRGA